MEPISANAYLGAWGIVEALEAGADIVVCPRVADASLVVGPAAWWHGWSRKDWDELAGAVAAGHVIECGTQCTGGNYPFLDELPDDRVPGFPIAEVAADGSAVITKHEGTGGAVTVGTVTAQLLYEIDSPAYLNPDVIAHFDTLHVTREDRDRVLVSGARGNTGPHMLKVALNYRGGYRNSVVLGITGLDIEAKAARAEAQLFQALGGRDRFASVDVRLQRSDKPLGRARTSEEATAYLHVTVKDPDPAKVGRSFTGPVIELALASYAGFHPTTPPGKEVEYGVYWPTLVQDRHVPSTPRCCRTEAAWPSPRSASRWGRRCTPPIPGFRCGSRSAGPPRSRRWAWYAGRGPGTRAGTRTSGCGPGTTGPSPGSGRS